MGRKSRSKREIRAAMAAQIAIAARRTADLAARPGYADRQERARKDELAAGAVLSVVPAAMPAIDHPWLGAALPARVPAGWVVSETAADGVKFVGPSPGLLVVMVSGHVEADGFRWVHGSVSGPGREPTWAEMVETKELFAGPGRLALMLIPPRAEWVNIEPNVLHWWVNVDRRPTPDFTRGLKTI